jgi:toxin YhaV
MLEVNGWAILAHPPFLDQLEKPIEAVEALKAKKPRDYQKSADAKRLAALVHLVTVAVPSDPTATIYRQGSTPGDDRKHWFRAKFGNGRFRLFFGYSSASKVIIFAWVNDENTLQTSCRPMGRGRMPTRFSREC